MTDIPIVKAGQTRTVVLDDRRYTIRALTYGEHADLQVARAARPAPGNDLIDAVLAEACRAKGRADLADAIDALHEAEDDLASFYDAAPPIADTAGRDAWWMEKAGELRALQSRVRGLGRKRRLALEMFGDAAEVAQLRQQAMDALSAAALDLVQVGVVEVDGAPAALDADAARALPFAHVTALADQLGRMMAPTQDAAKN